MEFNPFPFKRLRNHDEPMSSGYKEDIYLMVEYLRMFLQDQSIYTDIKSIDIYREFQELVLESHMQISYQQYIHMLENNDVNRYFRSKNEKVTCMITSNNIRIVIGYPPSYICILITGSVIKANSIRDGSIQEIIDTPDHLADILKIRDASMYERYQIIEKISK